MITRYYIKEDSNVRDYELNELGYELDKVGNKYYFRPISDRDLTLDRPVIEYIDDINDEDKIITALYNKLVETGKYGSFSRRKKLENLISKIKNKYNF